MESAGARHPQGIDHHGGQAAALPTSRSKKKERGSPVPKFTVNLSVAPEERYAHIAPHFREQISRSDLPGLFNELILDLAGPTIGGLLTRIARFVLRRVYVAEETAELRGISKATGVAMHVLVAFNVLLDLLLGCTSCGIRIDDRDPGLRRSRMVHFRTLDWGMDQLRDMVVEIDFVRSEGGPVVATSLTYFGYVGVLTGARQGLTMSLNFRPHHDRSSLWKRVAFRWHQAMVVLGFRQSISSVLRRILFDSSAEKTQKQTEGNVEETSTGDAVPDRKMEAVLSDLSSSRSTAAYLIFCLPQRVYVVEKDNRSALIRSSTTYLTAYNHDASDEADPSQLAAAAAELAANDAATGMSGIVEYSLDRKEHLDQLWKQKVRACRTKFLWQGDIVTLGDVMQFVKDREISNQETHYAVVMDPESGQFLWRRRYHI